MDKLTALLSVGAPIDVHVRPVQQQRVGGTVPHTTFHHHKINLWWCADHLSLRPFPGRSFRLSRMRCRRVDGDLESQDLLHAHR
jgi:hypothetical protein